MLTLPVVLTTLIGRKSGSRECGPGFSSESARAKLDSAPKNRQPMPRVLKFRNKRGFLIFSFIGSLLVLCYRGARNVWLGSRSREVPWGRGPPKTRIRSMSPVRLARGHQRFYISGFCTARKNLSPVLRSCGNRSNGAKSSAKVVSFMDTSDSSRVKADRGHNHR